jgi:tetratricopeptide (TPR) repeat protein
MLEKACDMDAGAAEAWHLRAVLVLSGLPAGAASAEGGNAPAAGSATVAGARGAPELADVAAAALAEARRCLELAAAAYRAPLAGAAAVAAGDGAANAQAPIASASGVGGALTAADEYALTRIYMGLGAVLMQQASLEHSAAGVLTPDGDSSMSMADGGSQLPGDAQLQAAKEAFMRAAAASSTRGQPAASSPRVKGSAAASAAAPWASAWLGVGRAAWAQGQGDEAEAVLSEANALDNQNPAVWAWLSYLCISADAASSRGKEAAFSLDQALKAGLVGHSSEATALLTALAHKYRGAGQVHVAAGLLRRAAVQSAEPLGAAHLAASLRARLTLAEVLCDAGVADDDALAQYQATLAHAEAAAPRVAAGSVSDAIATAIAEARHAAASAAATLLMKHGRAVEAGRLVAEYGLEDDA